MATIYIDNIIKPQKTFETITDVSKEPEKEAFVYKDLHLDFEVQRVVGNGTGVVTGKDIVVDYDRYAISNSLTNIFFSRPGFKLLDPEFGCSLEQFLFERITTYNAKRIGEYIINQIEKYEPRVEVTNVTMIPNYDENLYNASIYYRILNIKRDEILKLQFESNRVSLI